MCIFKVLLSNKSPTYSTEQKKNASIMVLTVQEVALKKSIQRMNAFFFSRHVPTLVNNFYDNKKLQFFISDFSLPRVTQAAAKCTVLYYYSFLYFCIFLSCSSHDFTKNVKKNNPEISRILRRWSFIIILEQLKTITVKKQISGSYNLYLLNFLTLNHQILQYNLAFFIFCTFYYTVPSQIV